MINLVKKKYSLNFDSSHLIDLETNILRTLDFDIRHTSPLFFLERYLRLFNVDSHSTSNKEETDLIDKLTSRLMRTVLRSQLYLTTKPSQIAAAVTTLALLLSRHAVIEVLGLTPLSSSFNP